MMISPVLTFAAPVWHGPKNAKENSEKMVRRLTILQNDCLRAVLGAYKATLVEVLEAEAEIPSLRIQLDGILLKKKALKGTHPTVQSGNAKIRRRKERRRRAGSNSTGD